MNDEQPRLDDAEFISLQLMIFISLSKHIIYYNAKGWPKEL
jgi:hypothetical protein